MASDHDDKPGSAPPITPPTAEERAMRDAEARALAESGLGSGLLARQASPKDAETVAVLKVCPQCGTEYETSAKFCPNDGTSLRPKGSDSLIGRVLADRYHILKRIGEGGMGRVYLGEHVKMNRLCAIKVMSPSLVNDAESAARFAREASNAARIIHPNVAAVFDYGESDGLIYLVMEYVEGEPLSRLLTREAPLAVDRALDLARQIADGLGAAHELGIIHRDLKPDNILIMRSRAGKEIAKVVDFGIAKAIREGVDEGLTRTGQVIGTPEFMSPEQLVGDPVDARSDLYALGCILHLMLTAAPPFSAATREQMIKRRLSEDAPGVHALDQAIPESVAGIVGRLLARSPKDRYGSAVEVRDALNGTHMRRPGVPSRESQELRPTPRSAPTVAFLRATQATTEVTEIPASKPMRRMPVVLGVSAVGVAAIAFAMYVRPDAISTEKLTSAARDSALTADTAARSHDSAVATVADTTRMSPMPPAGLVVPPAIVLAVDTAKLQRDRDAKRVRDSTARVAMSDTNAVRAAIIRYSKAIESGNVANLRAVIPSMTSQQQELWENMFFARADKLDASLVYGPLRIVGDSADAEFKLVVKIVPKGSKTAGSPTPINQRAILQRQAGVWQIAALVGRG
ncbi:MAG: serine/threonine-protein kinase [Gemmatimonadaceae bacterium]